MEIPHKKLFRIYNKIIDKDKVKKKRRVHQMISNRKEQDKIICI
jgi:hypothetical protein